VPMYLWMASLEGDTTVKGLTKSIELPFDEIFDSLEAVFTFHFEALYKKRWGFFVDYSLIDIKDSATGPGPFNANIEVDFTNKMAELGVIFRFHEEGPHILEALGGARFPIWKIQFESPESRIRFPKSFPDSRSGGIPS